jgi:hypothetical protein
MSICGHFAVVSRSDLRKMKTAKWSAKRPQISKGDLNSFCGRFALNFAQNEDRKTTAKRPQNDRKTTRRKFCAKRPQNDRKISERKFCGRFAVTVLRKTEHKTALRSFCGRFARNEGWRCSPSLVNRESAASR